MREEEERVEGKENKLRGQQRSDTSNATARRATAAALTREASKKVTSLVTTMTARPAFTDRECGGGANGTSKKREKSRGVEAGGSWRDSNIEVN